MSIEKPSKESKKELLESQIKGALLKAITEIGKRLEEIKESTLAVAVIGEHNLADNFKNMLARNLRNLEFQKSGYWFKGRVHDLKGVEQDVRNAPLDKDERSILIFSRDDVPHTRGDQEIDQKTRKLLDKKLQEFTQGAVQTGSQEPRVDLIITVLKDWEGQKNAIGDVILVIEARDGDGFPTVDLDEQEISLNTSFKLKSPPGLSLDQGLNRC
ncbi:MAG: hypothetical protein GF332_02115 [Candidatus Moranbacteria bacterium]|nr:hypothetical protein [Candidatus Moranbacteria bacterium]